MAAIQDETVSGLCDQVKKSGKVSDVLNLKLNTGAFKVLPESDAELLAELLRSVDLSEQIAVSIEWVTFAGDGSWDKLWAAMKSNRRIYRWAFSRNRVDAAPSAALASHFAEATHVYKLDVAGVMLTPAAMETIAKAAGARDRLEQLLLVAEHPVDFTDSCLKVLARVRAKFPQLRPCGGPPHGMGLNCLVAIAMAGIRDLEIEEEVRTLQKDLLLQVRKNGETTCAEVQEKLVGAGCRGEWQLLRLFPMLIDKGCTVGGAVMMGCLPKDFDDYRADLMQDFPPTLETEQLQVTWQLANASYQGGVLDDIAMGIMDDVAPLRGVGTDATYFLQALVTAFLREHGLEDLFVSVPQYGFTIPNGEQSGLYVFCGHINGFPAYKRQPENRDGDQVDWFLYRLPEGDPGSWGISKEAGSNITWHRHYDRSDLTPTAKRWEDALANQDQDVEVEESTSKVYLRDELLKFMVEKTKPATKRLLEIGDELVQYRKGPPKALARALEKGPKWLNDLNRGTFTFDSFVVMVVAYLLFEKRVEAKGGRITRFENLHLSTEAIAGNFSKSGGLLNMKCTKPPCLHINFVVNGWTFEVMFILADFARVKESLHKYYDLTRAKTISALLPPVFPPTTSKATTASGSSSAGKEDSTGLSTKVDMVLEALMKAERQAKTNHEVLKAELAAQTKAAEESKEQLAESRETLKTMEGLLEAQTRAAAESRAAMAKMEAQLAAQAEAAAAAQAKLEQQLAAALRTTGGLPPVQLPDRRPSQFETPRAHFRDVAQPFPTLGVMQTPRQPPRTRRVAPLPPPL